MEHPDAFDPKALLKGWCDSAGHTTEAGEHIEGGEKGWKRWLATRTSSAQEQEIEPDLGGRP